ncbi:hypothetical protein DUNSADRAFT_16841 [Dunaliella salina]|uniref:Encoded protein n=1 Tax=Dunaliella salina TaxID=3046 RepID=A0ABQ7G2R8_DUNSA|nr:hypothetical protein DUNSADRAFT_16841 [Dunaliella salina]|eukprot:KAF5828896.1 hypothetical protein DUNSADRAFT_16841 [Dunaliella salina]
MQTSVFTATNLMSACPCVPETNGKIMFSKTYFGWQQLIQQRVRPSPALVLCCAPTHSHRAGSFRRLWHCHWEELFAGMLSCLHNLRFKSFQALDNLRGSGQYKQPSQTRC